MWLAHQLQAINLNSQLRSASACLLAEGIRSFVSLIHLTTSYFFFPTGSSQATKSVFMDSSAFVNDHEQQAQPPVLCWPRCYSWCC